LLIFEKKIKILGPEKGSQIGPKKAPKKVANKTTPKSHILKLKKEISQKHCILQGKMGLEARFYFMLQ